ncbi:MAG: hypothetical protein KBC21_02180 [Candidatus Pacebacteria bacterium]|jgi:hypothetical protein|nr:hypothetical protein [Candidatus Paceibacterota bacterium]
MKQAQALVWVLFKLNLEEISGGVPSDDWKTSAREEWEAVTIVATHCGVSVQGIPAGDWCPRSFGEWWYSRKRYDFFDEMANAVNRKMSHEKLSSELAHARCAIRRLKKFNRGEACEALEVLHAVPA